MEGLGGGEEMGVFLGLRLLEREWGEIGGEGVREEGEGGDEGG